MHVAPLGIDDETLLRLLKSVLTFCPLICQTQLCEQFFVKASEKPWQMFRVSGTQGAVGSLINHFYQIIVVTLFVGGYGCVFKNI